MFLSNARGVWLRPWALLKCVDRPTNANRLLYPGRIQIWADPAPAPSFDSQIMQIQPFFGLYQPFGPLFLQI